MGNYNFRLVEYMPGLPLSYQLSNRNNSSSSDPYNMLLMTMGIMSFISVTASEGLGDHLRKH